MHSAESRLARWDMRVSILIVSCLLALGATSCRRAATPEQELLRGRVIRVESHSMTISPLGPSRGIQTLERTIGVDSGTSVRKFLFRPDGTGGQLRSLPVRADLSELTTGRRIAVSIRSSVAVTITILPEPPVEGKIVQLAPSAVTVKPYVRLGAVSPPERRFLIGPNTIFADARQGDGTTVRAQMADFQLGQAISITPEDSEALVVKSIRARPVHGRLCEIAPSSITLEADFGSALQREKSRVRFYVSDGGTKFFASAIGNPPQPAVQKDLRVGQHLDVFSTGETASVVQIVIPPVTGRVVEMTHDVIVIRHPARSDGREVNDDRFSVGLSTEVLLGRLERKERLPDARTAVFLDYVPGGKLADVATGDDVTVVALEGKARQILDRGRGVPR